MTVSKNIAYLYCSSHTQRQGYFDIRNEPGTYLRHDEGRVSDEGESGIKLIMQAHEPHSVEGIDDRNSPTVEAGK